MTIKVAPIKVALAGAGAFGVKHLEGIRNIDGVQVVSLVGRELDKTREVAQKFSIPHVTTELDESLARDDVQARRPGQNSFVVVFEHFLITRGNQRTKWKAFRGLSFWAGIGLLQTIKNLGEKHGGPLCILPGALSQFDS